MSPEPLYLRPDAILEPHVNRWYAWHGLVSPVSLALHTAKLHLPTMQSFVANPEAHVAAVRDPRLRGGPFVHYGPERVRDVRALMQTTRLERAHLIELADAVAELDALVSAEATGGPVAHLYPRVPAPLRGYVEIVYDVHHRPSVRLCEPLLYPSPHYRPEMQGFTLQRHEGDARPFALTSPRLADPAALDVHLPFAHEGIDALARARSLPTTLGAIREALRLGASDEARLAALFHPRPPRMAAPVTHEGVRIRYFGHACVLVETSAASVLVDPLFSYGSGGEAGADDRFRFEDLPERIDYALLTHAHQDHALIEHLLQLRHRIETIVVPGNDPGSLLDPSLKLMLRAIGFRNVVALEELESIPLPGGHVRGVPFLGEHGDLAIRSKLAYEVRLLGRSVLFCADSNNLSPELYDHVHDVVGDADVLFIGMESDGAPMSWLYGPHFPRPLPRPLDQGRRLNGSDCARATRLVQSLKPREVYVYAMGAEPWVSFLTSVEYTETSGPIVESNRFVAGLQARGIHAARLHGKCEIVLAPAGRGS